MVRLGHRRTGRFELANSAITFELVLSMGRVAFLGQFSYPLGGLSRDETPRHCREARLLLVPMPAQAYPTTG
jgi:hypothetical protein